MVLHWVYHTNHGFMEQHFWILLSCAKTFHRQMVLLSDPMHPSKYSGCPIGACTDSSPVDNKAALASIDAIPISPSASLLIFDCECECVGLWP